MFPASSIENHILTILRRTLFSASRFRLMASGFCLVQKTGVFSSGIPRLVMPNSCFKDTRTLSFQSHPALSKAVCSLLEVETCVREFGGSFHSTIPIRNGSLTDHTKDSRDTTPRAVEQLESNDMSRVKFSGYPRTLFSIPFSSAHLLVVLSRYVFLAATWQTRTGRVASRWKDRRTKKERNDGSLVRQKHRKECYASMVHEYRHFEVMGTSHIKSI